MSRSLATLTGLATLALVGCAPPDDDVDVYAGEPADCPEQGAIIDEDITADTVWVDGAGCDFLVTEDVTVFSSLNIEQGVLIGFAEGASLNIEGSLTAEGYDDAPIRFMGTEPVPGWWGGLVLDDSTADDNVFQHVVIADAGDPDLRGASLYLRDGASVSLRDSEISNGGGFGVYTEAGASLTAFADMAFRGLEGAPVRTTTDQLPNLDDDSDYDGSEGEDPVLDRIEDDYIHVEPTTVLTGGAWRSLDVPYRMHGKHYVELDDPSDALVLEPGIELSFEDEGGLRIDQGALRAIGTEDTPVTLNGVTEIPGAWEALVVQSDSPDNLVEHAYIAHGGAGLDGAFSGGTQALVVVLDGGVLELVDSTLEESGGACFAVDESSELDTSELETSDCGS